MYGLFGSILSSIDVLLRFRILTKVRCEFYFDVILGLFSTLLKWSSRIQFPIFEELINIVLSNRIIHNSKRMQKYYHLLKGNGLTASLRFVWGVIREPTNLATVRLFEGVLMFLCRHGEKLVIFRSLPRAFSES